MRFQINSVSEGELLQIITSEGVFDNADTELFVYSANDLTTEIAYDDDSNQNGFSRIVFENLPIGAYFINVKYKTLPDFNSILDYTITIEECVSDNVCISKIIEVNNSEMFYGRENMTAPCNGGQFMVNNAGQVIFISEHRIKLKAGFRVYEGGYFKTELRLITEEACFDNELTQNKNVIEKSNNYNLGLDIRKQKKGSYDTRDRSPNSESVVPNIKIYPNPAKNQITIDLNTSHPTDLYIYNIYGDMLIMQPSFSGGIINITALNNGIYVCKMLINGVQEQEKFVVL